MGVCKEHDKQCNIWKQTRGKLCKLRGILPMFAVGEGGGVSVQKGGGKHGHGWHNWDIDGDDGNLENDGDFGNCKDVGNCGDVGRGFVNLCKLGVVSLDGDMSTPRVRTCFLLRREEGTEHRCNPQSWWGGGTRPQLRPQARDLGNFSIKHLLSSLHRAVEVLSD